MALSRQCIANDSRHDNASLMIQLKMFKGIWFSICQKHLWICQGPRRTGEDRARDKRARRVTFEGSSRDKVEATVEADTTARDETKSWWRGWRRGTVKAQRWWRRGTVKAKRVGGGEGRSRTVEGGTAARTVEPERRRSTRRGRWMRDGGDGDGGREDDLDEREYAMFTSKAKLYAIAFPLSRAVIDEDGPGDYWPETSQHGGMGASAMIGQGRDSASASRGSDNHLRRGGFGCHPLSSSSW
ncbi:hypothetical protein Scep_001207 [Stephania cephalantha]|uniref:Uncharacterized protein n=1 Tax=Stephania cephalantha TaxID=152367 RepID=A0AAP0Q7H6_9MAGN